MKKSNVILQAAIASALLAMTGAASAGTLSSGGAVLFATEIAGPSASASNVAIQPAAVVYTFNTPGGIVVNPSGVIYAYQRVGNGLFSVVPLAGQYTLGGGITGLTAAVGGLSTDSTTVRISLTNGTTSNVVIGVGGTLTWTPIAGAINSVNTTLATVGGSVMMQNSVASSSSLPNTGTALPADLDNGLSNNFAIATAAEAVTTAVAASSSFATAELQKIDLTATGATSGPGARLTTGVNSLSTTIVNLGSIKFSNVTGVKQKDGVTDYTLAAAATALTLNGTVTGVFKTGATMALTTDLACITGIAAGSTGTLNVGLTAFAFSGGTIPTAGTPNYVCMTVPATTGAIPVTQPTASFTYTNVTTTDMTETASGTLYNLQNNGATVDVRSYIPAVTPGYTSYVRVINTGAVNATVTGQWIYQDGTTSTAATLIPTLNAGGSSTLTSAQIETALGAPTASIGSNRPRLRLTAPTNGMQAQSFFLTNANGNFSDATGGQ